MASSKRMKVDIPCDLLRRSRRDRAPSVKLVELTQLGLDDMFVSLGSSAHQHPPQHARKRKVAELEPEASEVIPADDGVVVETPIGRMAAPPASCHACHELLDPAASKTCHGCRYPYHPDCQTGFSIPCMPPTWFCNHCPVAYVPGLLTPFRRGDVGPLTQGGRELVRAVMQGRTPAFDDQGRISEPFGCKDFFCLRGFFSANDLQRLQDAAGTAPDMFDRVSCLTPSVMDRSRKVYRCSGEARELRGGRYAAILKASTSYPLLDMTLDNGQDLNTAVTSMWRSSDPFVTDTKLLCQQIGWHLEDLDPHCDKERPDKLPTRQEPQFDGLGDRITSLTLRTGCWLLLRETANHANCFALHLEPGDLYTMAGDCRWKWQHAILLDNTPAPDACRISLLWRLIEEYPA